MRPILFAIRNTISKTKADIHRLSCKTQVPYSKSGKVTSITMPPRSSKSSDDSLSSPGPFIRPPPSKYYTYRIQRGEQGVHTHEPYKSHLLPLWRFRTPSIAEKSSTALYAEFLRFYTEDDFVGMDMSRKFIQMGMTRSKRYANHKGGRKYDIGKDGQKVEMEKSQGHEGQEDKLIASEKFKETLERCKEHEGYKILRERYQRELKDWIRVHGEETPKDDVQEQSEIGKYIRQEDVGNIDRRPRNRPQNVTKEKRKIKQEEITEEMSGKPRKKRKTSNL
ncbi:hypothetical protein OCU04_010498 [Sclerotinia nivalis]|uniref:Uncharacterized protein n=1 Tax=Sclerotinia nivalis TaxID=352851 RepID=A0A9X0AC74_9HELO|nr:hypothetical protein OCU04_010498 [Sclerotinia nivalis]